MRKKPILSGALIAACTATILVLVTFETRVALEPSFQVSFQRPEIAYGYAFRNVFITGVVYTDEGRTTMGANRVVAVAFDGGAVRGTGATTSTGFYAISGLSHSGAGVVVTAFLQDITEDGVTVTTLSGGDLRQFNLYRNRLIVRADSGSYPLTNTHLSAADDTTDSDIDAVFRMVGTKAATQSGKALTVWAADTYKPGGNLSVGSGLTINGTLQPEANTITLSGSWVKNTSATFTFATSTVVFNGTNQFLSGSTVFKNLTKTVTAADTLSFNAGSTQTFTGALTLNGTESARLSLRSLEAGVKWRLNPQSTRSVQFLNVKDSQNINATMIPCLTGCIDSGGVLGWNFGTFTVRGTVYSDEGTTAIGANRIIAASLNGGARAATGATTSTGFYILHSLQYTGGMVVSVYLDNNADDAVTATILSSTGVTGFNLYKNRLIVRADSGSSAITNVHLATVDNLADDDLLGVFHIDSTSTLGMGANKELFVWTGDTYQPGARVKAHDVDVRGTMTLGTSGLTASGSVTVSGTMTTSTGILLTSVDRETLALTGVTLQTITFDNGLWGYWRLDDGTGSTVRDSSRFHYNGTVSGIDVGTANAGWVYKSSGTTLYYNHRALQFDGTTDFVNVGDVINPSDKQDFTITAWMSRTAYAGKHTILAKKTGSGASAAGYALWIDDASDNLQFAVSDDTDDYHLRSASTFLGGGWTHVAVVWDQDSASNSEIYVNGTADGATDVGTIGNVGDLANTENLRIGAESDGERSFEGKLDDVRIYRRALGPSEIRALAQGNKATGSGTYTLGSTLDVNGNLQIYAGTLDVSAANKTITAAGNIDNQGGFERGSGTVTLDGTNQTLSGSTFFNALRKIATSSVTLFFDFTSRQSVSGSLVLTGESSSTKMLLRTTKSGSTARLVLDTAGNQTLQYLNVKDNRASSGVTLSCATSCTDSGNNFNWSFACGDGVVSSGETCDDGNTTSSDGCSASCATETGYTCTGAPSSCSTSCGDSIIAGSETCDNGGSNSNAADAACRTDCTAKRCGDGITDTGEACDDGNATNSDNCTNTCQQNNAGGGGGNSSAGSSTSYYRRSSAPAGCGNAILEPHKGEECDEGRFNDLGTCSYNCKQRYCGDGEVTVVIGEECEPTPIAGPDGERLYEVPTCGQICTAPDSVGRGGCHVNYLPSCDQASSAPSNYTPYDPGTDSGYIDPTTGGDFGADGGFDGQFPTGIPYCGNAVPEDIEECDDGNNTDGDGCSAQCVIEGSIVPVCGDGIQLESEECDDGNNTDGDGCSAFCQTEQSTAMCGNAILDGEEECDAGAGNSATEPDACRMNCRKARCGDFVVDVGEQCDEGEGNSATFPDRCRPDCRAPHCGDGVKDSGEDCDGGLSCTSRCRRSGGASDRCGDGALTGGEECDDGNTSAGDGCSALCARELPEAPVMVAEGESLVLDADIVVINPTEIAVALKFLPDPDPCARVTASGEEGDALSIRNAATRQGILQVKNVSLAQALRADAPVGSNVRNALCDQVNALRPQIRGEPGSEGGEPGILEPIPMMPPSYVPIASFLPTASSHPPVGDTGPGAFVVIASGAASGWAWIRRRMRK